MRYLISDIHGCYDQYRQLLQKINFSSQDELYVLGDAVDRGSDPIKVLQDLMRRPNVIYILGNHDLEMYLLLNKLTAEITETVKRRLLLNFWKLTVFGCQMAEL